MNDKEQKSVKEPTEKKREWTSSTLTAAPIVDKAAGSKRRWRFERRFRNFEVRNRFAS